MTDLMVITAHPDDESLYCGGLIARYARGKPVIVTLTRGGSGRALGMCDRDDLPSVREKELCKAAQELGVAHADVHDLPDGQLASYADQAVALVEESLRRWRPTLVVTFGPNGMNGHPDHMAAHRVVLAALDRVEHPPDQVWFTASADGYTEPARPGYLPPVEVNRLALPVSHTVQVGTMLTRKLRALGCHETQARSVAKFLRRYPERVLAECFTHHRPSNGGG